MPLFEKRPTVIEARLFAPGENIDDIAAWCGGTLYASKDQPTHLIIPTLEGPMRAELGDYVIEGIRGEFYSCKPDIFLALHDPCKKVGTIIKTKDQHERPAPTTVSSPQRVPPQRPAVRPIKPK